MPRRGECCVLREFYKSSVQTLPNPRQLPCDRLTHRFCRFAREIENWFPNVSMPRGGGLSVCSLAPCFLFLPAAFRAYLDGQFQKELLSSRVPVCIAEKHADAGPYDGFINYHEGSPCVTPKPCVGMACAWRSMSVASKDRNGSLGPTLCRSSCSKRGCPTSSTRPEKTERRARLRSSAALLP